MALWYWWYTPHGIQCMDDRHFAHLVIQSSKFILFVCVFIRHPMGKPVRSCSSTSIHPNCQGAEVSGTLPHPVQFLEETYRKISNIRRTQSPNLNVSRLVLQLSLPNPMKPVVKSRMKMQLEQRRQAMLQLHLSDRHFYCLLRCVLY